MLLEFICSAKIYKLGCHGQALLVRAYCKTRVNKFTRATQIRCIMGCSTKQVSNNMKYRKTNSACITVQAKACSSVLIDGLILTINMLQKYIKIHATRSRLNQEQSHPTYVYHRDQN